MASDQEQGHKNAVAQLRAAVQPAMQSQDDADFVTERTLERYLVARNWDVHGAIKTLTASLEWRRAHVHRPLRCEHCERDPGNHCIVPLGWSTERHPIVWGCPARGKNSDGPAAVNHIVAALEHVFSLPQSADQWIWCVDFSGFGLREASQVQIGMGFATVLPHHYPERLHKIVMINRPYFFDILLGAIKPFLDARTLGKLVSVRGSPEAVEKQLIAEHGFTEENAAWVAAAMRLSPTQDPSSTPPLPKSAQPLQIPSLVSVTRYE